MDKKGFVEVLKKIDLPFVFSGAKLNDETCKEVLDKMGAGPGVLALVVSGTLADKEGIAITESGIVFSGIDGAVNDMPKTKGSFSFSDFLVHNVEIKPASILPKLIINLTLYDNAKQKGVTFEYQLAGKNLKKDDATITGLTNIFKSLVTKPIINKNPNDYDFEYGDVHTIVTLNDDNIVIKKFKIDDKTKIQTPKGASVTISRAAIGSVKIGRTFSYLPLAGCVAAGILVGFIIFGGIITVLVSAVIGFVLSFPKAMVICRKDGTKYKTVIRGNDENAKEYDRLVNVIFK